MDYKRVLRLHFVNHLSGREIAESCGDCSKTTVNEFLKRFRENPELSYPLPADVTNEYIESILYKKPGVSANQLLYRDFNKGSCLQGSGPQRRDPEASVAEIQCHRCRRWKEANELSPVLQALQRMG